MEAPEKIFICDYGSEVSYEWHSESEFEAKGDNDIEYTHTDAFIEKACDAYCKVCGHYPHKTPTHICRQDCDYFDDFKRYLKGSEG